MIYVDLIAAARPNFMKVAPLYKALAQAAWCKPRLVHTGQHYDANMSDAFFADLDMPAPHVHLGVGSGTHAEQTGGVMIAYERECLKARPDWVIVVGDGFGGHCRIIAPLGFRHKARPPTASTRVPTRGPVARPALRPSTGSG